MTQTAAVARPVVATRSPVKLKFVLGGLLIVGAIIFLIASTLANTAQYFYSVDEIKARGGSLAGSNLRASGAVIGETITYDPETLTITFEMAHIPVDDAKLNEAGGLALVLHNAVIDPSAQRLTVVVHNQPLPDLLKNEAQAIVTGTMGEDGKFYAEELLLKCPTRYDEAVPAQAEGGQ
ncbi:MAG TPA: cytochrome c maturation protein CcmE [Anaerolineales bacterium]|nr:cytochrome c maturation protein CcmE [Anaerolineales bacterium]HRF50273.1 cytochrome c maturation protein CcmE [Anaerolineales bacterium]